MTHSSLLLLLLLLLLMLFRCVAAAAATAATATAAVVVVCGAQHVRECILFVCDALLCFALPFGFNALMHSVLWCMH